MNDVPFELPVFRGFTVDARLREFRKAGREVGIEFVPFDSKKGRELLAELMVYSLVLD